jgi:hypothetical protein
MTWPDLRGVKIDRVAADVRCAGTGFIPGVPVQTPAEGPCNTPVPIANNEVSFRVRRTNERRPEYFLKHRLQRISSRCGREGAGAPTCKPI